MPDDETPREVTDPRAETLPTARDGGGDGGARAAPASASSPTTASDSTSGEGAPSDSTSEASPSGAARKRRRRGSRGGRNRSKARRDGTTGGQASGAGGTAARDTAARGEKGAPAEPAAGAKQDTSRMPEELPERPIEGRPRSVEAAADALVPKAPAQLSDTGESAGGMAPPKVVPPGAPSKPKIGDTLPAPPSPPSGPSGGKSARRRRRGKGRGRAPDAQQPKEAKEAGAKEAEPREVEPAAVDGGKAEAVPEAEGPADTSAAETPRRRRRGRRGGRRREGDGGRAQPQAQPVEATLPAPVELEEEVLEQRRGRRRKGRPVGRYLMCVHVTEKASQIAVLEGRSLIEHYVSRPSDDVTQIHGNIYLGRVQNVLPGMEAAFVDIGTPKNAVLYRGDVQYDPEDVEQGGQPRIETVLKAGQTILCQVTKNPIGAKGARLTQEVSLPGRHVVLIPNSSTYGISKRLPDEERRRLRQILDRVKPAEHGLIVRTASEGATAEEITNDVQRLVQQWQEIERLAKRSNAPALLYREPEMAVRVIREEFSQDYRGIIIDDRQLYEAVRDYVQSINPTLVDRVQYYDVAKERLPAFERYHVHEQLHRALDRKVWLPSGGSLIIEHAEALTVIDVNTGKNVGKSSLEETVYKNNLEAAVEIARQLRLRDIGGIIVVDFIDMERKDNRADVVRVFREALARDKTRTQVFEISELGLCEMTRKRIGEGLLESYSMPCPTCEGRGVLVDQELLPE
jgi:ribonuclease E